MEKKTKDGTDEKLDILIKLFAYNLVKDIGNQAESIRILKAMNIPNKYIALILGTTENYISTAMARNKKFPKKKNGKKK